MKVPQSNTRCFYATVVRLNRLVLLLVDAPGRGFYATVVRLNRGSGQGDGAGASRFYATVVRLNPHRCNRALYPRLVSMPLWFD